MARERWTVPLSLLLCALAATAAGRLPSAEAQTVAIPMSDPGGVPVLTGLVRAPQSELGEVVERFRSDWGALSRRYDADYSPARKKRLGEFFSAWQARLAELDFDRLSQEGKIDYILLTHRLRYELYQLDRNEQLFAEMEALLPFAPPIVRLQEARQNMEPVVPRAAADAVAVLGPQIDGAKTKLEAALRGERGKRPTPVVGARAMNAVQDLRRTLGGWYRHYSGYDPLFTWWVADPFKKTDAALVGYERVLRERVVGQKEGQDEPIVGDPIGAKGLEADLALEMIPYGPKELIAIAEREFAWCEAEMKKAARDMGCENWKDALEKVKTLHVEPGQQPELIRKLALEATEFVEKRDLVTVPALAKESWRVEMMSPERQKVSPFFTGGEVISVAFPTDTMAHEDKLMSLRGNNIHFSRATVQHELIPGHHLQQFMYSRYNSHRRNFYTPFWIEGWALYWEMLLWDQGFAQTPEDRVGMLFWRSHRAARILFSLNVHLGRMTPQEAIDLLVNRVGHERANATAEVRRSFNGSYPPLYQAAYMLGGLQLRALHREVVGTGKMTNRQFHDAILQGGIMPIELVRARLTGAPLTRDYRANWQFADGKGAEVARGTRGTTRKGNRTERSGGE